MAFVLSSVTKIGNYTFKGGINDLEIKKNVHVIVDTAKIKIPGLGRVVAVKGAINLALSIIGLGAQTVAKNLPVNSVETAKLFKEGDPVAIDLAYNGDLRNEFRGFVRRVNLTTPISIEMEGYAWQLRNQNILASWKKTTLKEVLTRVIEGTDIVLSPDVPVINLTSFYITNESGLKVLEYFKEKMLLTVYFDDDVLYAGIEEGRSTTDVSGNKSLTGLAEVKYNIGYNCITNQPNLKQRLGKDNLTRVRLVTCGKDGKKTLYEAGDPGGAVVERKIDYSNDAAYLKDKAAAFLKKLKYDGYEGTLTGFLQPFCKPGWKATITDKKFDGARAGTYFIAGTEVRFGVGGAKRLVAITYRLDAGRN